MKKRLETGLFLMIFLIISCSSDDDSTSECEFSWTDALVEQAITDCIDEFSTREECTCVMDKTVEEFSPCDIGVDENLERLLEISSECGLVDCEVSWTNEMKQAAIEECIDENNSVDVCTCAVNTTAQELTVCETLTAEGLARQLQISVECGVQPTVD